MSIKIRKLDSTAPDFQKSLHAVLAFEASEDEAIERSVAQILNDVKTRGDAAVLEYTNRFDRVEAQSVGALELPMSELEAALESLEPKRRAALVAVERRLPDLPALLQASRERVQERGVRLILALPNLVATRRSSLEISGHKLVACLRHAVARIHTDAGRTLGRLSPAPVRSGLREARAKLDGAGARLEWRPGARPRAASGPLLPHRAGGR